MSNLRKPLPNGERELREAREIRYAQAYAVDVEQEDGTSLPEEYFHVLMRHKVLIGSLALSGIILSALVSLSTQPVYRTRTSLSIQSLNREFLNMKSVDPTASTPTDIIVQTQVKLLESDSLADRVRAKLTSEPHPLTIPRMDLLSSIKRLLHIGHAETIPYDQMVDETAKNTKVKPLGLTQLLELTCDSWDPKFAVKYCTTLTDEFQKEDLESRGDEARKTSEWLMHQAVDIRQKAQDSQQKLIAATGGNGLILSEQSTNVGTDALRSLQAELVKAQADRMEKQAEISSAETSTGDMMPRSVQSSEYGAQKAKLLDLQQQVAALVPPLTEANPRVIHLREQIKQAQTSLDQETSNSQGRLLNEYEAAKHREELLRLSYNAKQSSVSSDLQKASNVDLLRREVESEQQLYQTLLQRAKEAGFASAMQATTIRTVDEARLPHLPVYPRRLTSAIIGFLVGSTLGVLLALFVDRRSDLLRAPGDSPRLLQVEELGVVPSPQAVRGISPSRGRYPVRLLSQTSSPKLSSIYGDDADESLALIAEAYQGISQSLLLADRGAESRTYVVTSPNAHEGKTTVVTQLGVALGNRGKRVLLIDADLRKPALHLAFDLENQDGLSEVLQGMESDPGRIIRETPYPNLEVLTSGRSRGRITQALHSANLLMLLKVAAKAYDVVLIDTPPMLHITDARIVAGGVDAAILVFRAGVTTREQARDAQALLTRDKVQVIGSILNDFNPGRAGKYGYYSSYYAYHGGSGKKSATA